MDGRKKEKSVEIKTKKEVNGVKIDSNLLVEAGVRGVAKPQNWINSIPLRGLHLIKFYIR